MTGAAGANIETLRVAAVDAAQQQGQRIRPLRHDDQVNVIGHEAPAEQTDLRFGHVVAEESQVGVAVEIG